MCPRNSVSVTNISRTSSRPRELAKLVADQERVSEARSRPRELAKLEMQDSFYLSDIKISSFPDILSYPISFTPKPFHCIIYPFTANDFSTNSRTL